MDLPKKISTIKRHYKIGTSLSLMVVLILALSSISLANNATEATIISGGLSSDMCSQFRVLCEEETPPEEEPPTTGGGGGGDADFRAIFLTYVNGDAQRALYNQELDSRDLIVMHLGLNQAPPTAALDDLDAISSVPDSRKGLEFFSLPEIRKYAPLVAQRGWGFISYDLEGISPDSEEADPVRAVRQAKSIADAAGISLMVAPSQRIVSSYAAQIAPHVDRFHMQSQAHQDNDSTCRSMHNWINSRIAAIENAKPSLAGEITAQVTLTNNAAPGKTIYQTAKDCLDRPLTEGSGRADGMSFWFGTSQFRDGTYRQLVEHFESRYS